MQYWIKNFLRKRYLQWYHQEKLTEDKNMACFTVTAAEAVVVTAAAYAVKKHEEKKNCPQIHHLEGNIFGSQAFRTSFSLPYLNIFLYWDTLYILLSGWFSRPSPLTVT